MEQHHHADIHTTSPARDKHAGHSTEMFRNRFWICLALTIPVVLYSGMVQEWLHVTMPEFGRDHHSL